MSTSLSLYDAQANQLFVKLLSWKNTGNDCFKQQKYAKALAYYASMLRYVGLSPIAKKELLLIDSTLYNYIIHNNTLKDKLNDTRIMALKNMSAVHFKLEHWYKCIDKCRLILKYDAKDVKTLFRRSQSHKNLNSLTKALHDIQKAILIQPNNKLFKNALNHIQSLQDNKMDIKSNEIFTNPTQASYASVNDDICQKYGIKPSSLYKLAKIPFKGYGLIANCEINKGSMLLTEAPLFCVDGITRNSVQKGLKNIRKKDMLIMQTFSHSISISSDDNIVDIILDIMSTNCISIDENLKGLYATVCRINHECKPNAIWHYDTHKQCQCVVALKSIKCGEEITVSYISNQKFQTKMKRREYMLRTYGFYCECGLCSDVNRMYNNFDAINMEYQALKERYFDFKDVDHCDKFADVEHIMKKKLGENAKLMEINKSYFDGDYECVQLYAERMQMYCDPRMRKFDEAYECMISAIKYYLLNNGVFPNDVGKITFGECIKGTVLQTVIDSNYSKFPHKLQKKIKQFIDSVI